MSLTWKCHDKYRLFPRRFWNFQGENKALTTLRKILFLILIDQRLLKLIEHHCITGSFQIDELGGDFPMDWFGIFLWEIILSTYCYMDYCFTNHLSSYKSFIKSLSGLCSGHHKALIESVHILDSFGLFFKIIRSYFFSGGYHIFFSAGDVIVINTMRLKSSS